MVLKIVLAGIVGTAVMTSVLYLVAFVTRNRFKVVKVLGTMLTFQTTPDKGLSDRPSAIIVGIFAHYLVGIGFTFVYDWLWSEGIVQESYIQSTGLGLINGIVGAIVWKLFISIHPDPPHLPVRQYLIAIVVGHVFFAYGILSTYLVVSG